MYELSDQYWVIEEVAYELKRFVGHGATPARAAGTQKLAGLVWGDEPPRHWHQSGCGVMRATHEAMRGLSGTFYLERRHHEVTDKQLYRAYVYLFDWHPRTKGNPSFSRRRKAIEQLELRLCSPDQFRRPVTECLEMDVMRILATELVVRGHPDKSIEAL